MFIDFHTHANLAKRIPSSIDEFEKKMEEAKASGLTAVAITEHFNSRNIIELYEEMESRFPYQDEYYTVSGMKVFCGLEVDVRETGHFLVIGSREHIMSIAKYLLPHQEKTAYIKVNDLIALLQDYNVLKIGAHPLREKTPWNHHETEVLEQFDAFDLNGKDLYTCGREMEQRVKQFAEPYNIPVVGGSDTHQAMQYGSIRNELPECNTIDELREAIKKQDYKVEISPCLEVKVKAAAEIKRMIKEKAIV